MTRRCANPPDAHGNAVIEFLVLGVLTLVPLIYLVTSVFEVQRNLFATKQAAREAGRAIATADDIESGQSRADYAAKLAMHDQGLSDVGLAVTYAPSGSGCPADGGAYSLEPGSDFVVCATRVVTLPGIPGFLDARRNTVTGRFVVHIDDFRDRGTSPDEGAQP